MVAMAVRGTARNRFRNQNLTPPCHTRLSGPMNTDSPSAAAKARRQREAEALRENLRRRKEQQRARAVLPPCEETAPGDAPSAPAPDTAKD